MISTKSGTTTWSKAAPAVEAKSNSAANNVSAGDSQKYFGGEAVGDTLNKISDPNFVDSSKKMRTVGDPALGKDAFMTLLLTQMKNQDPTNPLKSHEMAAQLAQFTSLEKLNNINDGIANLRKDNQPDHNFQALTFIGKTVTMDNSKIQRAEPTATHDLKFLLAGDAQKANVEVRDAAGVVVRTLEMKNLKAGPNKIAWNGKNDEGKDMPVGDYTLNVEALGSNGKKLFAQTKAEGIVTGVNFTAHGPQLLMGKQVIQMSDVKEISDTHVGQQEQLTPQGAAPTSVLESMMKSGGPGGHMLPLPATAANAPMAQAKVSQANSPSAQSPKKVEVKTESKDNAEKRASLSKGNINDLAMTQGLINHLNKEGAKAGM